METLGHEPERLWKGGGAILTMGLAATIAGALLHVLQTTAESLSRLADNSCATPPSPPVS